MNWIFLGVIAGCIAYLAQILLRFLEDHRESRARIEQCDIDIQRQEDMLRESEHARTEAEDRTARLEEEALGYEQQSSELQHKIREATPGDREAPSLPEDRENPSQPAQSSPPESSASSAR